MSQLKIVRKRSSLSPEGEWAFLSAHLVGWRPTHTREGSLLYLTIDANVNVICKQDHRYTQNSIDQLSGSPGLRFCWHLELTYTPRSLLHSLDLKMNTPKAELSQLSPTRPTAWSTTLLPSIEVTVAWREETFVLICKSSTYLLDNWLAKHIYIRNLSTNSY